MPLISELEKIGLSEKEASVYLAALELGQNSVQEIAKKAGVNRATTYIVLDSLMKKGLCSTIQKNKKVYYMAESPEVLSNFFEVQKIELEEKQKNIDSVIPQLKSIYNLQEDKPVVRYFEGKEGLRAITTELQNSQEKLSRMFYSEDLIQKVFSKNERMVAKEGRIKKGIKTRAIYNYSQGVKESTPDGMRIKVPEKDFPITCDVAIFDNKVRIATVKKKLNGIIIQDEDIANSFKTIFDLAWEAAQAREKREKNS